ncbi:hypothetical protein [Microvirga guangxiensis]|nr:hypothetical protein [Microvirga guangxiensis]
MAKTANNQHPDTPSTPTNDTRTKQMPSPGSTATIPAKPEKAVLNRLTTTRGGSAAIPVSRPPPLIPEKPTKKADAAEECASTTETAPSKATRKTAQKPAKKQQTKTRRRSPKTSNTKK